MELTACAFQDLETDDGAAEVDSNALCDLCFDVAGVVSVAVEGVWVWLSVDGHACPAVGDDLDVGGGDVRVLLDEVGAEDGGEEFGGCDGVFFGFDVDGVFHGVGGYDDAIVGFGVSVVPWLDSYWEGYGEVVRTRFG